MPHRVTGLPVVGMVGAGQLARMTHEAASALGLTLAVLAEDELDAAALVTPERRLGAPDDPTVLEAFARFCDVVTFDHEQVPPELVRAIVATGTPVRPGPDALVHAQDKRRMREALEGLKLPIPAWAPVHDRADVSAFAEEHGWPLVVKSVRGGYDGRGVWMVDRIDDVPPAPNLLVEAAVPIERELAAVVARRPSGEMRAWPVVETVQENGMCVTVIAPAPGLSSEDAAAATVLATTIAEQLGVVGVLAVELFQTRDTLLVNELAMRPHNSAHWTIEGAATSQFEQHLRAVLDWPLGDPSPRAPVTVMHNVVGTPTTNLPQSLPRALETAPDVRVHLYGKQSRPGRKLGHVTTWGTDPDETLDRARRAAQALGAT